MLEEPVGEQARLGEEREHEVQVHEDYRETDGERQQPERADEHGPDPFGADHLEGLDLQRGDPGVVAGLEAPDQRAAQETQRQDRGEHGDGGEQREFDRLTETLGRPVGAILFDRRPELVEVGFRQDPAGHTAGRRVQVEESHDLLGAGREVGDQIPVDDHDVLGPDAPVGGDLLDALLNPARADLGRVVLDAQDLEEQRVVEHHRRRRGDHGEPLVVRGRGRRPERGRREEQRKKKQQGAALHALALQPAGFPSAAVGAGNPGSRPRSRPR